MYMKSNVFIYFNYNIEKVLISQYGRRSQSRGKGTIFDHYVK